MQGGERDLAANARSHFIHTGTGTGVEISGWPRLDAIPDPLTSTLTRSTLMSTAPPPKNGGALVRAPKPRSAAAAWARALAVFLAVDFSVRFSPLGEVLWTTLLPHVVVAPLVALFLLSLEVLGLFSSSRSCGRLFPLVPCEATRAHISHAAAW